MKKIKENIKQAILILIGILCMCIGYFNYNLDTKNETIEVARERRYKRN